MIVKTLESSDAVQVAQLHIDGIPSGFISSLGHGFVTALYEAIASSPSAFGYVAIDDKEQVAGFATFTTNMGQLYKAIIKQKGIKMVVLLAGKMLNFSNLKRIIQNLLYPSRNKQIGLPESEFLSLVVSEQARGQGLAKRLIQSGLEECRNRGIKKTKLLVAADNEPANRLYQSCGFELAQTTSSHGVPSNIYVIDLEKGQ